MKVDDEDLIDAMEKVSVRAANDWLTGPIERRWKISQRDFEMEALFDAGYRLDPYPNGKSKDELIKSKEAVEAERDRAKNLLREEHDRYISKRYEGTPWAKRNLHAFGMPNCHTCAFLAETSTVKS